MTPPRLLITGASGFVGQHLTAAARARGWHTTVLVRDPARAPAADAVLTHDLNSPLPPHALADITAVCHLAAFVPPDMQDARHAAACLTVNALGTLHLVRAAVAAHCTSFVYLSSGNAYSIPRSIGDAPLDRPAREDDPLFPAGRGAYYFASKIAAELYLEHAALTDQLAAARLRPTSIYGPGMPAHNLIARFTTALRAGQPITVHAGGRATADLVHVHDVVAATLEAVARQATGAFNLGGGRTHTLLEIAQACAHACQADPALIQVQPAQPGPAGGFPGVDNTRATTTLAYRPRTLPDGLTVIV